MRSTHLVVVTLVAGALAAAPCRAEPTPSPENPPVFAYAERSHPSMPPRRLADCVTYTLLDNKCTADWYKCSDNGVRGKCVHEWGDCCTLPGNPARTTIVRAPQTP